MKKILLFGGGTGLSIILKSIKKLDVELIVGVAITDNGGSTGKIRDYYNIPAPGDLRRVILELASDKKSEELYNYRFDEKLEKHTLGNLLLAALVDIEGGMDAAVQRYCEILNIENKIYPITNDSVHLCAKMNNNDTIYGEVEMVEDQGAIQEIFYEEPITVNPNIVKAIEEVDMIIFSCGSLYTSLLANLLAPEIQESLKKTSAKKVYIANIMTQAGETTGYTLSDHLNAIQKHTFEGVLDFVIANNNTEITDENRERYLNEGSRLVEVDGNKIPDNIKLIQDDFLLEDEYVRHNTEKLAREIMNLVKEG